MSSAVQQRVSNNLSKLQNAMDVKLGKKKKFIVTFEQRETFTVEVDAVDRDAAREEANEIYNNGGAKENGDCNSEEINCEEA